MARTERRLVQTVRQTSVWKAVSVRCWWQSGLFYYCFDNACCPSVWNTSYLLTLYKGKGDTSDPNSARGIALQSRRLNSYYYILDRRMYKWAEWSEVFPDEQHGFKVNRSTETAIRVLQNITSDTLSEAKTPLYVAFVDFAKAFDSIDRTLLFGKLKCCGISTKCVKALWPLIIENVVQIISARNVSDKILQTKGIPQGQCLSPHLYSIFTADMPTAIKHETVDIRTQCIVYADDLAICCHSVKSLQACLDNYFY